MDTITDRHTSAILKAAEEKQRSGGPPNPIRVAHRRVKLKQMGMLPGLESGQQYNVRLPGGRSGIATGVNAEGLVQIKDWDHTFDPKVITVIT